MLGQCTKYPFCTLSHYNIGSAVPHCSIIPVVNSHSRMAIHVVHTSCSFNCDQNITAALLLFLNFPKLYFSLLILLFTLEWSTFSSLPPPPLAAAAPLLFPFCYHSSPHPLFDFPLLPLVEDLSCFPLLHHQPHPQGLWSHCHLCPENTSNFTLTAQR